MYTTRDGKLKKKSRIAQNTKGGDRTLAHENYRHSLLNLKYLLVTMHFLFIETGSEILFRTIISVRR